MEDEVGTAKDSSVLWNFLPRYDQRFAIPYAEPGSAYREPPEDFNPNYVF